MDINQYNIYGDNNFIFGPQARHLNESLKSQLKDMLKKGEKVKIVAAMNNGEAYDFADEIRVYLDNEGYEVHGIDQVMTMPPMRGQLITPDLVNGFREIRIGVQ